MPHDFQEPEFSDAQLERIDEIHNAVYDLCRVLTENDDLEWNMAYIGRIADVACAILVGNGHRIRYPARVTDDDSPGYIEEYYQ